ncbi:MAG: hypothetical protein R3C45_00180 [Phycisphaerales bacterium]
MTVKITPLQYALAVCVTTLGLFLALWQPPRASAQEMGFSGSIGTDQMMADQLMAMAWMIFGRESEPRPDQLERARILLDMAVKLAPDDEGMWQLRASLARTSEDQGMLIDSLNNYLRLEPNDDAAQLELIKASLSRVEAMDDYLAAVERMLRSERAEELTPALRSRLATLAAQVAQETGDPKRSAAWLAYAIKLDEANPDAARMMYQLAIDREGTPRQVGAALIGLLKASPVDASVRLALANHQMKEAIYDHAVAQFNVAMNLVDMQTRLEMLTQYTLCLIASGREDEVPPLLLELQMLLKQMADAQNPDLQFENEGEQKAPSLDDLPPLPTTLEFARLILMHDTNPVAAKESFQRLRDSAAAIEDSQEQQDSLEQLAWVGAVFNQDADWVQKRIDLMGPDNEHGKLASGWLALRRGETENAKAIFESLGPDNMFARLGLAELPGLSEKQKADAYQQIVWDDSTSMGAVVAARRLNKMGKIISPTGDGVPLRVLIDNLPQQLWTPALTVSPWVRLNVTVSPGSFGYLQPMKAHVTVRNATRMPLSVGQGGAIQNALMVMCAPSIRNEPLGRLQPTFFNMGRRLTLQPGASIQADIRLDRFDLGQLAAVYPTATVTYSATTMLDPRPLANGGIVTGPLGAQTSIGSLQARGTPATPSNLQLWMKDLDGTDPAVRATAIARLLVIARQPAEGVEMVDLRDRVRDLISQRYPDFNSVLQAWTVRFMLPDDEGQPVAQRVIDLAQRSDDPMVRIVYLVMNAKEPTAPALNDAVRHDDPTIRAFAQAMKTGLEEDAKRAAEAEAGHSPDDGHGHDAQPANDSADPFAPGALQPGETPVTTDSPWLP